jgi:hypothetical protein
MLRFFFRSKFNSFDLFVLAFVTTLYEREAVSFVGALFIVAVGMVVSVAGEDLYDKRSARKG